MSELLRMDEESFSRTLKELENRLLLENCKINNGLEAIIEAKLDPKFALGRGRTIERKFYLNKQLWDARQLVRRSK